MDKNRFKILIVDDISKNIQLLGNLLREESYNTGFATSGKQALDILKKNDFDLILLDIMMPEMDGYEVCRQIRKNEKTKNIPIIFLTAKIEDDAIIKGFEIGAQDYVTKPFKPKELLARVTTHLELNHKRKQLKLLNDHLEEKVKERTKQLQEALDKLEEANSKLNQLEKAKGKFLGIISHELRTPLNGIMGFASILKATIEDKEQLDYLDHVLDSANRLLKFAKIAILIAQLSIDRYKLDYQDVELKEILNYAIKKLEDKAKERNVTFDIECPDNTVICNCDKSLMQIAVKSVLDNAIKYSPVGEKIKVVGKEKNNKIVFTISDNGDGFTEEALKGLYEFFYVENVFHHEEGHGLGLAATKLILEAHGSSININNKTGKGAEVTFEIQLSS